MEKQTRVIWIILAIIILIVIAYYIFIVRPAQRLGTSNVNSNINNNNNSTPNIVPTSTTFSVGEPVYLKLDAPSAGSEYGADETVVYSAPFAVSNGDYVIGKMVRGWYGNQPIGTVVQDNGNWVKVQVGKVSDFRVYPFIKGQGYGNASSLIIPSGKGARDVFFGKDYLTNVQY